jgi:DnaK suppressor protein
VDLDDHRRALLARRAELQAHLADLRRELSAIISASADTNADDEHDPEGATIAFERSQLSALIAGAVAEQTDVDRALTRCEDGNFGRCERCGQQIAPERLAARPATRFCVTCAALA